MPDPGERRASIKERMAALQARSGDSQQPIIMPTYSPQHTPRDSERRTPRGGSMTSRIAETAGLASTRIVEAGRRQARRTMDGVKYRSGRWQVSWREDEEEEHDDGRPSKAQAAEMGVCCTRGAEYACGLFVCRCKPGPMALVATSAMAGAAPTIGLFLSDTAAYIASKMWDDMLSSEVFHIMPLPYCGGEHDHRACTAPASYLIQFVYSFGLLAVATVLRSLTERHSHHGLAAVPSMLGMCVGWAFGRAFLSVLTQMEANMTGWCDEEHHLRQCGTLLTQRAAYAAMVTVLSSMLILSCRQVIASYRHHVVQELYLERWCARQSLRVERAFEALVALVERAAMTTCMMCAPPSRALPRLLARCRRQRRIAPVLTAYGTTR